MAPTQTQTSKSQDSEMRLDASKFLFKYINKKGEPGLTLNSKLKINITLYKYYFIKILHCTNIPLYKDFILQVFHYYK